MWFSEIFTPGSLSCQLGKHPHVTSCKFLSWEMALRAGAPLQSNFRKVPSLARFMLLSQAELHFDPDVLPEEKVLTERNVALL